MKTLKNGLAFLLILLSHACSWQKDVIPEASDQLSFTQAWFSPIANENFMGIARELNLPQPSDKQRAFSSSFNQWGNINYEEAYYSVDSLEGRGFYTLSIENDQPEVLNNMVLYTEDESVSGFIFSYLFDLQQMEMPIKLAKFSGELSIYRLDGSLYSRLDFFNGESLESSNRTARSSACESFCSSNILPGGTIYVGGSSSYTPPTIVMDCFTSCDIDYNEIFVDNSESVGGKPGPALLDQLHDRIEGLCPFGYTSNPNGEGCVPDVPCEGDPLKDMEISDYNSGKSANRFGCVRTGKTNCSGRKKHGGIDLMAPIGTHVYALVSGTVVHAAENHTDFGNWLIIKKGDKFYTYAHLNDKPLYNIGDDVNSHSLLGYVGETGNVPDGEAHLHLAVREQTVSGQSYNDSPAINPEIILGTKFDNDGNKINNENCN